MHLSRAYDVFLNIKSRRADRAFVVPHSFSNEDFWFTFITASVIYHVTMLKPKVLSLSLLNQAYSKKFNVDKTSRRNFQKTLFSIATKREKNYYCDGSLPVF